MDISQCKTVISAYSLGEVTAPPVPLTGGLMHHMYRVETTHGVWALKRLNPAVMCRPEACDNMRRSERIARAMAAYVPVVAALPVCDDPLVVSDDVYYMLYPWQSGVSIFPPALTTAHCAAAGTVIGRMHAARLSFPDLTPVPEPPDDIDWQTLDAATRGKTHTWAVRLIAHLPQCERWHEKAHTALSALSADIVFSHRDLDPKNVLWEDGTPCLIDWEAAGPVNPALEFFTALRDWSNDGSGFSPVLSRAMLSAYRAQYPDSSMSWSIVRDAGRESLLEWLAYNVRRACGIEAADETEQKLGATQVCATLDALDAYDHSSAQILCLLGAPENESE